MAMVPAVRVDDVAAAEHRARSGRIALDVRSHQAGLLRSPDHTATVRPVASPTPAACRHPPSGNSNAPAIAAAANQPGQRIDLPSVIGNAFAH
jgi:hypothetical protein